MCMQINYSMFLKLLLASTRALSRAHSMSMDALFNAVGGAVGAVAKYHADVKWQQQYSEKN